MAPMPDAGSRGKATGPLRAAAGYQAFVSYSHSVGAKLASALYKGLRRLARSPFRTSALRIFRDTASLFASPPLWAAIEEALDQSNYLILLASPEAANSRWIASEIGFWSRHKNPGKILIALTAGDIVWDESRRDFDWERTTALPAALKGAWQSEPLWVDFRWARHTPRLSLRDPQFRNCVAALAAPLHNRSKEELVGDDIRQARRFRQVRTAGLALLVILVAALGYTAIRVRLKQAELLRTRSLRLAEASVRQLAEGKTETGLLLALEALAREPFLPQAEAALYRAMQSSSVRKMGSFPRPRNASVAANQVFFSPDGTRAVTTGDHMSANVWDPATGKLLVSLTGHDGPVWSGAYDPAGRRIVTASVDGSARIWDGQSGQLIRVLRGHTSPVLDAVFSADGRLIATASADGTARLWDAETGANTITFRGHQPVFGPCCVQINRDGTRVLTASADGTARLWELRTGHPLALFKDTPRRSSIPINDSVPARFTPDGIFVITGHADGTVRIWRASDGSAAGVLNQHQGQVTHLAFSSDGRQLATLDDDGMARVWDLETWSSAHGTRPVPQRAMVRWREPGESGLSGPQPQTIAFAGNNETLITLDTGSLRMWSIPSGRELATIRGDGLLALSVSRDGSQIAVIGGFGTTVYALVSPIPSYRWTENARIGSIALSRDGKWVATSAGRQIIVRDGDTGRRVAEIPAQNDPAPYIEFNSTGDRFLTISGDSVHIWNTAKALETAVLRGAGGNLVAATFSPTMERLATATSENKLELWTTAGNLVWEVPAHEGQIRQVAFGGAGTRLLTASADGTARVWEAATGKRVATLRPTQGKLGMAALNSKGDRVVTSGRNPSDPVCFWNVSTAGQLRCANVHSGTVTSVLFGADGGRSLTAAADSTAVLYGRDGETEQSFGTLCFGPYANLAAALGQNGERVVTLLQNGRIDLWNSGLKAPLLTLHTYDRTRTETPCHLDATSMNPWLDSAAISADLRRAVTVTEDGAVTLFVMPTTRELIRTGRSIVQRTLSPDELERLLAR